MLMSILSCSIQETSAGNDALTVLGGEMNTNENVADSVPAFPHEEIDMIGKIFRVLADEGIGRNNLYYDDLTIE